jgi:hypothetical protein
LSQLIDSGVLLVNGKLRVTDNVDKQDMRDLQFDLFLDLGGHVPNRITIGPPSSSSILRGASST